MVVRPALSLRDIDRVGECRPSSQTTGGAHAKVVEGVDIEYTTST